MLGDAGQNVPQVTLRIDPIQLCCSDQGINRRGAFPTSVGSGEEIVLSSQSHCAQRSTPPIISASLCCPRHDALRSIFWMLRRPFFTGLACMLSSGFGKRRIGATTSFAAQSIRRFSLAWPYFRMSVAQRRMSWPFDMLARSPLIAQKPSELVARPSAVVIYFYVHHGIHSNRQCASASHNWFGWVLDARRLRLHRSRTLGWSGSGLPDISCKH